jgi:hypothetical protein
LHVELERRPSGHVIVEWVEARSWRGRTRDAGFDRPGKVDLQIASTSRRKVVFERRRERGGSRRHDGLGDRLRSGRRRDYQVGNVDILANEGFRGVGRAQIGGDFSAVRARCPDVRHRAVAPRALGHDATIEHRYNEVMRLFAGRVSPISQEVVKALVSSGDIEAEHPTEVVLDVEAVLKNYLQMEKDVNEQTRELLEKTNRGGEQYSRVRDQIADSKGIKVGEETLDYLLDQVVEMFGHSRNVDEIYAQDVELRRKMAPIFKKHMGEDEKLDSEVRANLRHVKEGTRDWDVEYGRMVEIVKRKRGLG